MVGWFKSLSSRFLACRSARLLVLAGTDRLDKELMIGQMQGNLIHPWKTLACGLTCRLGKYQLQVFPEAGHFIHEDQPAKTANVLVDFYRRNDRGSLVLPPKVGDILKGNDGGAGQFVTKFPGH